MLCKKCGANIEDNSKFCGYCGEVVSEVNQLNQNIRETNQKLDQIQPGGISNNQTSQAESVLNIFGNVNNDTQNTISTQPSIEVNSQPINSEVNASEISSENTITSNQNTIEVQHSDINTVSVEAANIQSVNNEENNVT